MKRMALLLIGVVWLLAVGASAGVCDATGPGGKCCDCTGMFGNCITTGNPPNTCECHCDSIIFCFGSGGPCTNGVCKLAPMSVQATIQNFPWITTPGIVRALAKDSVMPSGLLMYDSMQSMELKVGGGVHKGILTRKVADALSDEKIVGAQWFLLTDDENTGHTELLLYYDANNVWKADEDIHHSPIRIPVTERVIFYSDHWEQVNAKGTFTGKVGQ
jgi:hypothetical protein